MATRVTISIDDKLLAAVRDAATSRQSSVSAVIADAAEREMTRLAGLEAVREWEAEHGELTAAERAAANQKIAKSLSRMASQLGDAQAPNAA